MMSAFHRQHILLFLGYSFLFFAFLTPIYAHAQTAATTQIDLIVEPQTLVPDFYQGRTLPIAGEPITITAIPHTSANLKPEQYTYTWKLNNTILFGGPVQGLFEAEITMPSGIAILGVAVQNASGVLLGNTNIEIRPAEPELLFYEDNPLRSMSRQAFGETFTLVGEEVSVHAEPYFVARNMFEIKPVITWLFDGREIQNFGGDPQILTLRGTGGSGDSNIGFSIVNPVSLQSVNDSFTIHFEN